MNTFEDNKTNKEKRLSILRRKHLHAIQYCFYKYYYLFLLSLYCYIHAAHIYLSID